MINICALSDMHGTIPEITQSFDLMLIAGDTVSLECQVHKNDSLNWYNTVFVDWINQLPFKDDKSKVVFIAGNHDIGLSRLNQFNFAKTICNLTGDRAIYLFNEKYVFQTNDRKITIFGTPYCKMFGNWAFMKPPVQLEMFYSNIPKKCDILLSHDAPYGTSDICFQWANCGRVPYSIGNEQLRDAIIEKKPKICIHGHLHSANHDWETLEDTKVVNVSILDEYYNNTYQPLYFDYDKIFN